MEGTLFVVLEAHARCATLYLRGGIDAPALERAVALIGALPPAVRDLRIDARELPIDDAWTRSALRAIAYAWQHMRGGDHRPPGAVTISLQDRGLRETDPRELLASIENSGAVLA